MANHLQVRQIVRFHRHLERCGRAVDIEQSARIWIVRYAKLWRVRFEQEV